MKKMAVILGVMCGLLNGLLVGGCASSGGSCFQKPAEKTMLQVLQFNIWQEGKMVDDGFEKIVDAIIASRADVVAFSEVTNSQGDWHERVIKRLREKGHTFYGRNAGGDVGLISRYPVVRTDEIYTDHNSTRAFYLELPNKEQVLVCSVHLDYKHYGVYLPRGYNGGDPDFEMIDENGDGNPDRMSDVKYIQEYNEKSLKDEAVRAVIKYVDEKVPSDMPVILAGDFNDASHLDWTRRAANLFDHNGLVIPWQNSIRLQEAGFVDAYRKLYPDEVKYPGTTWPSAADGKGSTSWTPKSDERDRIDYIYYKGETIRPRKGWLVGPRQFWAYNKVVENSGMDKFICDKIPWPSDHKGVLIEFELGFSKKK
jgi:hypothetical protein